MSLDQRVVGLNGGFGVIERVFCNGASDGVVGLQVSKGVERTGSKGEIFRAARIRRGFGGRLELAGFKESEGAFVRRGVRGGGEGRRGGENAGETQHWRSFRFRTILS